MYKVEHDRKYDYRGLLANERENVTLVSRFRWKLALAKIDEKGQGAYHHKLNSQISDAQHKKNTEKSKKYTTVKELFIVHNFSQTPDVHLKPEPNATCMTRCPFLIGLLF